MVPSEQQSSSPAARPVTMTIGLEWPAGDDHMDKQMGGPGGSLVPPGPLLELPGPLLMHLHTVYIAYSECLSKTVNSNYFGDSRCCQLLDLGRSGRGGRKLSTWQWGMEGVKMYKCFSP